MNKRYNIIEKSIDCAAFFIVLYHFLRFVNVISYPIQAMIYLDYFIILVLTADYLYRYRHAADTSAFLKETWVELLSLIPFSGFFRVFRIFRIIKKSKFAQFFSFAHQLLHTSGLYYAIVIVFLLATLGGAILFKVEESIPTFSDGIWFSFVTMTTVGYGDFTPTTELGRWISIALMILGVGFISVLSGGIASFLVRQRRQKINNNTPYRIDLSDLNESERQDVVSYLDFIRHNKKR
ncbi:MAG: potassium channel family protein [Anaerorhabdus sp.]